MANQPESRKTSESVADDPTEASIPSQWISAEKKRLVERGKVWRFNLHASDTVDTIFVTGQTGCGKSALIHNAIASMQLKRSSEESGYD